jgi:hypothetical protein
MSAPDTTITAEPLIDNVTVAPEMTEEPTEQTETAAALVAANINDPLTGNSKSDRLLRCSCCGASATAACDCGVEYVPAGKLAALAVAANPERSDRAIAAKIGVDHKTVAAARRSGGESSPHVRVGRDGKLYPAKKEVAEPRLNAIGKPLSPLFDPNYRIKTPLTSINRLFKSQSGFPWVGETEPTAKMLIDGKIKPVVAPVTKARVPSISTERAKRLMAELDVFLDHAERDDSFDPQWFGAALRVRAERAAAIAQSRLAAELQTAHSRLAAQTADLEAATAEQQQGGRLNRKTGRNLVEPWPVFPSQSQEQVWRSAQGQ